MRVRIANRLQADFGMVPRALWQMDLPFAAKGLAAYLFCLPDGAVPYVAEIEAAVGIGRDARRKAFAALQAAGLIEWHVERGEHGAIMAKTLVLHPLRCCAPESQADGENRGEAHHAPEKPADGKAVDVSTANRRSTACGSGDTLKEKKERAREAGRVSRQRQAARPPQERGERPAVRLADLGQWQRASLLSGQPVYLGARVLRPNDPDHARLRAELREVS